MSKNLRRTFSILLSFSGLAFMGLGFATGADRAVANVVPTPTTCGKHPDCETKCIVNNQPVCKKEDDTSKCECHTE